MTSWLEAQGLRALRREAKKALGDAVSEIKQHITHELEMHMADLQAALDRLTTAMTNEFAQIRAEAQANLAAAQAALDAATTENAELQSALQTQVEQNTAPVESIDSAQTRIDATSSELEANDPPVEPPVEP